MPSASIYFFAGDFADVLRRFEAGEEQTYATHNEVAKLMLDLTELGIDLTIYSYVTPDDRVDNPLPGLRIVSLGARTFDDYLPLRQAIASDSSEAIIAHFPSEALLKGVLSKPARLMAVLANSYRATGIGPALERRRIAKLLNNPRYELVSNHCLPATNQLASMGVARSKLVPWNIPLRFNPADRDIKTRCAGMTIAYAGGIRTNKGVGDLIAAVAELKKDGINVNCRLAGGGDIQEMGTLARELNVEGAIEFRGLLGNVEVFDMFCKADIVAVPSHPSCTEGFPLTMFEAIASRTPIVCTKHPMFAPVMKEGATAATFMPADPKSFAAAIRRVLFDSQLYATLSRNADLSWAALQGPADWRTLMKTWIYEGAQSAWVKGHILTYIDPTKR